MYEAWLGAFWGLSDHGKIWICRGVPENVASLIQDEWGTIIMIRNIHTNIFECSNKIQKDLG